MQNYLKHLMYVFKILLHLKTKNLRMYIFQFYLTLFINKYVSVTIFYIYKIAMRKCKKRDTYIVNIKKLGCTI